MADTNTVPGINVNDRREVVELIKETSVLLTGVEKRAQEEREKAAQVRAMIPQAVDAMIEHGHISEILREKAAEQLVDHARAIEILASVAANREEKSGKLGNPGEKTEKAASFGPSSFRDAPNYGEVRESDRYIFEKYGIQLKG